jgi:CDP-paratose 2-epimerase
MNRLDRPSCVHSDSRRRSNRLRVTNQGGSEQPWQLDASPVVITGGAGFIGANLAGRLLALGQRVLLFDNLSRPGVASNLGWLTGMYGNAFTIEVGDIRDYAAVERVVANAAAVFHFAAQVAVTSSLSQPREDFLVNAKGTLNVLEALRTQPRHPPLLFTSTNKVYGSMANMQLGEERLRYVPDDRIVRERGIDETAALDFHSPYGCSKGCADQYVLDYSRSFGLPALVFRMSCIYGPLQCGNEDQGWVAHFASSMYRGDPITVYGNGKQVRDLLFVDDLIDAMLLAVLHLKHTSGRAFNIGGGPGNACSVAEVVSLLSKVQNIEPALRFADWRKADQRYYVSDTAAFRRATGWQPKTRLQDGIEHLCSWLQPATRETLSSTGTFAFAR